MSPEIYVRVGADALEWAEEACVQPSIAAEQKYCPDSASAIKTCQNEDDCQTGDVCCMNHKTPFCLPPSQCPRACTESTDCKTSSGEVCCTSVANMEPTLEVKGLCNNPDYPLTSGYTGCPKECTTSTDCNTSENEICCDGLCTTDHSLCPKKCKQSSDCDAQICCKSALVRVPDLAVYVFSSGPTCTGTPSYACSSSVCASILGCTPTASGTCNSNGYSCSTFSSYESDCALVAGCTYTTTPGSCSGVDSSYACASFSGDSTYCVSAGCTYDSTTSECSGTTRSVPGEGSPPAFIEPTMELCLLETEATPEVSTIDVPAELSGPNWSVKNSVCAEGGFDLAACAGKTVTLTHYASITLETMSSDVPLQGYFYSDGDELCCVILDNGGTPGVFSPPCGSVYLGLSAIHACGKTLQGLDEDRRSTEIVTLPTDLASDPLWGPRSAVCEEAGYDLAACADQTATLFSADEAATIEGYPDPIRLHVLTNGQDVCCLWETDGSSEPGVRAIECTSTGPRQ